MSQTRAEFRAALTQHAEVAFYGRSYSFLEHAVISFHEASRGGVCFAAPPTTCSFRFLRIFVISWERLIFTFLSTSRLSCARACVCVGDCPSPWGIGRRRRQSRWRSGGGVPRRLGLSQRHEERSDVAETRRCVARVVLYSVPNVKCLFVSLFDTRYTRSVVCERWWSTKVMDILRLFSVVQCR